MVGGSQMLESSKLICIALLFIFSCANNQRQYNEVQSDYLKKDTLSAKRDTEDSLIRRKIKFIPDSTINKKFKLDDYRSSESFYPKVDKVRLVEFLRESPVLILCNNNTSQYLLAYQYEGNTKNAFSCFEIGYLREGISTNDCNITNEKSFETEAGITLGLSFDSLVAKKGGGYEIKTSKDSLVIYKIDNHRNSEFLNRYNMPGYFLECSIKGAKINKIKFGFDYP